MIDNLYDVIIIGGGPAGLTAAIYLTRAKYRVLLVEKNEFGGQIRISHEVINYPGVGICSGKELTDNMYRQAEYFGTEFLVAEAKRLDLDNDVKTVYTDRGEFRCLGVLLATGAHPKQVGFVGEEEFKGRGVAYCATCDGEFFTGKEVFVIGGGYAAAEESIFLTKFASKVTILIREDDFSCAKALANQAREHEKINVILNTIVEKVSGENGINYIRYKNLKTGELTEYKVSTGENIGVFVFAGYAPETELVKGIADLDERGYVITDNTQKTSASGLYAAGDICIKPLRQVVTATGDGALAATELEKYVSAVQRRTGLYTKAPDINKDSLKLVVKEKIKNNVFTSEIKEQLYTVFDRMQQHLILKLYLDKRPVSEELYEYMNSLANMTNKLTVEVNQIGDLAITPCVKVYLNDEKYAGIAFHGVPGGHEFTSFVLGLYNVSGPGQELDEVTRKRIVSINKNINIVIAVSLSCTMCPDLVVAAQHIASVGKNITAEVYDISNFKELKDKYKIMSVPCMIINEEHVFFGKKNIQQILDIIERL